jgi:hypothetical protein
MIDWCSRMVQTRLNSANAGISKSNTFPNLKTKHKTNTTYILVMVFVHHLIYNEKFSQFELLNVILSTRRSQWLRGPRHELSSLARTMGSWVRSPLEVWMSICVYVS